MQKLKLKQDINGFWRYNKKGYYAVGDLSYVMLYAIEVMHARGKHSEFKFVLDHYISEILREYNARHRISESNSSSS